MISIVKDFQYNHTEDEELEKTLADMIKYFETDCYIGELKNAAGFVSLMYSKHVKRNIGQIEFIKGVNKLINIDPIAYSQVLSKYIS